jgi:hypothetical protein
MATIPMHCQAGKPQVLHLLTYHKNRAKRRKRDTGRLEEAKSSF